MNNSIKKIAISLSAAILIPASAMAGDSANVGYQSLNSAKQALNAHLNNPTSSTDPFIKSGSSAIDYSKEESSGDVGDRSLEIIDVYRFERSSLLEERSGWIDSEQVQLANKIKEAKKHKEDGEHVDIDAIYEEYHNGYSNGRLIEIGAAKEKRITSIVELGDNQSDLNRDSVNAHRTSVNNLLKAYNERRKGKSSSFLGTEFQNKLTGLGQKNNRVQPVIERAALFGVDCPACQMPEIPVTVDPSPPVQPPVYDPEPIVIPRDPCNGELRIPYKEKYLNPYIRYKCP
tara:strand:+ start:2376 stop:3239 length:864 start_codon:yes stop_codon:yes gene_type:complete